MKRITLLLVAVAILAGIVAFTRPRLYTPMTRPPRSSSQKFPPDTGTGG